MIWISLTIMVATIVISCTLLRSWRGDAIGIPLVAIGTFAFLYVIQPMQLILTDTGSLFLTDWQMAKGLLVPALMLACFMGGWLHRNRPRPRELAPWDAKLMWKFGFAAACVGLILFLFFVGRSGGVEQSFSQAHGAGMDYEKNTAYIYYAPWWMLSGSVMMFLSSPLTGKMRWSNIAPYAFLSIVLLLAIFTGGRGPFFACVATYFAGTSIALRKKVSLWRAARLLVPVGVGVILLVGYRDFLHLGAKSSTEVPSVETAYNSVAGTSEYDREHATSGLEFLYHAVLIDTVDQTGKLEYGVSWIVFLVTNPIPRLLWPDKVAPAWIGVSPSDIREHTSFAIAPGSAPGIAADLYERFHLFSVVIFYALGFGLRRLFIAARNLSSPMAAVGYVMLYATSLNMFAQGFGACFVPLGYSMIPVALFAWVARQSNRKAKMRRRELVLRQVVALRVKQCSS